MCVEIIFLVICLVALLFAAFGIVLIVLGVCIFWYLFLTDRDAQLAFYERFGKGVSRYGRGQRLVVWVTGASTGLGETLAQELARNGSKIILTADSAARLEEIKQICIELSKGKLDEEDILVLPFKLRKAKQQYIDKAVEQFGRIDVIIGNLGALQLGHVSLTDIKVDKEVMEINFFGFVAFTKLVTEQFKKQKSGQICVISSMAGKFGIPGQAAYSASKHALHGYFDAYRTEYNRYNINVTIVCLGYFECAIPNRIVILTAPTSQISESDKEKFHKSALQVERIAHLILLATINNIKECRIAKQPFHLANALNQHYPDMLKKISSWIYTEKRLRQMYEGKWPNFSSWKPIFVL